jgi:hypothetical protein
MNSPQNVSHDHAKMKLFQKWFNFYILYFVSNEQLQEEYQ